MRVGVFYFPTDYGIDIAELARALEERGLASLYVPEHTAGMSRRWKITAPATKPGSR